MKICESCNQNLEDDARFCPYDGAMLTGAEPSEMSNMELLIDAEEVHTSIGTGPLLSEETNFGGLVDSALLALAGQQSRDLERLKAGLALYDTFTSHCRVVQDFIEGLRTHSDAFRCKIDYRDQIEQMWVQFGLSIGEGRYRRKFPILIRYAREPRREVVIEINLLEIGRDRDERIRRTGKVGGAARNFGRGYTYLLTAPRDLSGPPLLKWLERSFSAIFQLAYSEK